MKRKTMSAAEFMAERNADPEYEKKRFAREEALAARAEAIARAAAPVLQELAAQGCMVVSLDELALRYAPLPGSITRTLLEWLSRVTDAAVQEQIVRALAAVREPFSGATLARLFEGTQVESLRWAIANTI